MLVAPAAISALPPRPNRGDPDNVFAIAVATFLAALDGLVTQTNSATAATYQNALEAYADALSAAGSAATSTASAAAAVAATTLVDTCNTNVSPTAGAKAITLNSAGRTFTNGVRATMIRLSDPTIRGSGIVSLAAMGAAPPTMTITFDQVAGAGGPYNDWLVISAAFETLPAASTAAIRTGTATNAAVTPGAEYAALAPVALADASTVTPDFGAGIDFTWTINGSTRTLANPTNAKVGQRGTIEITEGATPGVLAVGSAWKRGGGLGVLSTSTGAIDDLVFEVKAVSGGVATRIVYDVIRAPS